MLFTIALGVLIIYFLIKDYLDDKKLKDDDYLE